MWWMRYSHGWIGPVTIIFILSMVWKDIDSQPPFPGRPTEFEFKVSAPRLVKVQQGLCVHIPCTFRLPPRQTLSDNSQGFWLLGDPAERNIVASKLGNDVTENSPERIAITGELKKGSCSVRFTDVKIEDGGKYTFRIEDGALRYSYSDDSTRLEVTELLDSPEISPRKSFIAGQKVTLMCTSPGRCSGKAPTILWKRKNSGITTSRNSVTYEDGTQTHHANITFTPSVEDNQSILTCEVTFAGGMTTSESIILDVDDPGLMDTPGIESDPGIQGSSACSTSYYILIVAIVAGNVLLLLIILAMFCYFKKQLKAIKSGRISQRLEARENEHTYQELQGQKSVAYDRIIMK